MSYKYKPKNKKELVEAIKKEIFEIQGSEDNPNWKADLNCIDTSLITDMSDLFSGKFFDIYGLSGFNGNISKWDVSNVKDMSRMFVFSEFNGDISNWDVSNVKYMVAMFYNSEFNQDISNWDVSNVENMKSMFSDSKFNQDISNWNVSNVKDMSYMFENSPFNRDISKWNVSNVKDMNRMFAGSKFNKDISNWDVSNVTDMSYMFDNSKFNGDIGSWPLGEDTELKNISVSTEYNKLPDKIVFHQTVKNILQNKKILYEPETIAKLFVYSLENNDDKNFDFKLFFKDYLDNRRKLYKNKGYKPEVIKKLMLNDIADILKNLKDKDMKDKFMKITINKNRKEPDINIS